MTTAVQSAIAALERQDRSRPQLVKQSHLGGDGNDTSFEQAFSNLAHAYLADKAPSLLDYEQGFQLLDRNPENTKAVGVMGFKVGSQQLYAPVFFLQGDLKGHEMLYLKQSDLFVPLKESWLNYLMNRKPSMLGEGVQRQTQQLGVMSPDLSRLRLPYKYASAMPEWAQPFAIKYASLITDGAFERDLAELEQHCHERLNLADFIKNASLAALESLVAHCEAYPEVGAIIAHFHGTDCIREGIKSAAARERTRSILESPRLEVEHFTGSVLSEKTAKKDPDAKQKVDVLTYDTTRVEGLPEGLTEEDQEKLLKEKVLIRDKRDDKDVSVPYNVQAEKRLYNPQETGLYYVLVKQGEFEKCLIIVNPHGPHGRKQFCTVVRIEGEKNWINSLRTEIWVTSQVEGDEYDKWYNGLEDVGDLSVGDQRRVLVGPRGNGTIPFKVLKDIGEAEGTCSYEVDFSGYCDVYRQRAGLYGRSSYEPGLGFGNVDEYSEWRDGQRIHLDAKDGTDLRSDRGDLWVPKGYKKLSVEPTEADIAEKKQKKDSGPTSVSPMGMGSGSATSPIQPGNLVDAEMAIMMKTASLRLIHDGTEVFINSSPPISPLGALVHLVRAHGFREDVARHMLKQAEAKRTMRYHVKYADPYLTNSGPSAPYFPEPPYDAYNPMGANVPTRTEQEQELPIPELSASRTDRSVYDPRPSATPAKYDQQAIQSATQSGQKEVFDTAMIGSMLKAVHDDTMVDRYLPDMVKGMDRKARVLFQLYANGDKFAERYGKQDLPELEDGLRNAFESDGDVIIFLKQKTVQPFPEQADAVEHDPDQNA
jgi:hypothetical protein